LGSVPKREGVFPRGCRKNIGISPKSLQDDEAKRGEAEKPVPTGLAGLGRERERLLAKKTDLPQLSTKPPGQKKKE